MSGIVLTRDATLEFKDGLAPFRTPTDKPKTLFAEALGQRSDVKEWAVVDAFFPSSTAELGHFVGLKFEGTGRTRSFVTPGAGEGQGLTDFLLEYHPEERGYRLVSTEEPCVISFVAKPASGLRVSNLAGTAGLCPGAGWYVRLCPMIS
jgi:hypothetical protein